MKKKKILKYFELPIDTSKDWGFAQWLMFVIESLYATVFPFIAGMLLVQRQELVWVLMLILPIYFRLNIERKTKKKRRIYVK
jgi:hypothetical protein